MLQQQAQQYATAMGTSAAPAPVAAAPHSQWPGQEAWGMWAQPVSVQYHLLKLIKC